MLNSNILLVTQIILSIIFVFQNLFLIGKPTQFGLSSLDVLLLILLAIITIYRIKLSIDVGKFKKQKIFSLFIFVIALILGVSSTIPQGNSYAESDSYTKNLIEAAQEANSIAEQVKKGELTEDNAKQQLNNQDSDKEKEIANIAYNDTKNSNTSIQEIINKSIPTVNVELDKWNCNNYGCAYGGESLIYTITNRSRYLASVLNLAALMIIAVISSDNKFIKL